MSEYVLEFPTPDLTTYEEWDTHHKAMEEMLQRCLEEQRRVGADSGLAAEEEQ